MVAFGWRSASALRPRSAALSNAPMRRTRAVLPIYGERLAQYNPCVCTERHDESHKCSLPDSGLHFSLPSR